MVERSSQVSENRADLLCVDGGELNPNCLLAVFALHQPKKCLGLSRRKGVRRCEVQGGVGRISVPSGYLPFTDCLQTMLPAGVLMWLRGAPAQLGVRRKQKTTL